MANTIFLSKRLYFFFGFATCTSVLIVTVLGVTLRKQTIPAQSNLQNVQTGAKNDPYRYLPDGAKIDNPEKDVVFADLNGDGKQEEIIFYSFPHDPHAGILVLKPNRVDYVKLWEVAYDDSWGFYDLSGVYDLNKSGRPQIIAYRRIGASCPGVLEVYEFRSGKIARITGAWAEHDKLCGSIEFKDLDGDGRPEIIHKQSHGINPDVYRWNGKQYFKSNREFSEYYNDELSELIRYVYSPKGFPTNARVTWCQQAVEIYLLQNRHAEAVALCSNVLRIIDDPQLTKPNAIMTKDYTPEQLKSITAWFEIDKTEGKATIYHLLGDTYKASANTLQAQADYQEEQKLRSQAEEMKSKLPPIKLAPVN